MNCDITLSARLGGTAATGFISTISTAVATTVVAIAQRYRVRLPSSSWQFTAACPTWCFT
jgi:hypothetical protein